MSPPSRAIRTPQIFLRIFCAFLRDSGTPIFQTPKPRRKICGKSAQKWAQKSAHQKSAQKWAQKSAHQKSAQKWAQKSAHQKSAQKTGLNIPFVWRMEARKKTQKKSAPNLRKTPTPRDIAEIVSGGVQYGTIRYRHGIHNPLPLHSNSTLRLLSPNTSMFHHLPKLSSKSFDFSFLVSETQTHVYTNLCVILYRRLPQALAGLQGKFKDWFP